VSEVAEWVLPVRRRTKPTVNWTLLGHLVD